MDAQEKTQFKHEGSETRREHHKHDPRDMSTMRPSRRPYGNSPDKFTPLNIKRVDILR